MKIRFRIHDRAAYPDGAVLDVPAPSQLLLDGCSGLEDSALLPVADVILRTEHGVGYGPIWLNEPTLEALDAELARLAAFRDDLERRRQRFIVNRKGT